MFKREDLKLRPGSRWDGDGVVDSYSVRTVACNWETQQVPSFILVTADSKAICVYVTDALAVIRAAGLDPELNEALAEIERLKGETVPKCATCPRFVPPDETGRHGWCRRGSIEYAVPADGSGYCWRHPEAKRG
jgi:hypothetical protein